MSLLPLSIPRATDVEQLYDEPLGFLARSRSRLGDIFVIREAGSIFSQAPDGAGAIAVFGPDHHRIVLSDIDLFGMPVSAAERLSLPQSLINLNRGLHSMRGEQHAQQQRLLQRALGERSISDRHSAVCAVLVSFSQGWQYGQQVNLLDEMRELTLQVSTRLLLGDRYDEATGLALLLQTYFQFRREVAAPFQSTSETLREELIALGSTLDGALRRYIRWCRTNPLASSDGVLAQLASLELETGRKLSEDELVAHSNVLLMSSTEPVAVALTWVLLVLSQLPGLRRALRHELDYAMRAGAVPSLPELGRLTLLASVVNETLRLLPPNALMVRVTTRPAPLEGMRLPEGCELLLCPFLAHRDAERFPRPHEFLPSRWIGARLSPFEFFPFGAGGHACVGRHLAIYLIKAALALLLPRYQLVLSDDQEIDWRIHIQLMPRNDPVMTALRPDGSTARAGKLLGPVSELLSLAEREP